VAYPNNVISKDPPFKQQPKRIAAENAPTTRSPDIFPSKIGCERRLTRCTRDLSGPREQNPSGCGGLLWSGPPTIALDVAGTRRQDDLEGKMWRASWGRFRRAMRWLFLKGRSCL